MLTTVNPVYFNHQNNPPPMMENKETTPNHQPTYQPQQFSHLMMKCGKRVDPMLTQVVSLF